MSRTYRYIPDEHDGTMPTRKKANNKAARKARIVTDAEDATRLAAYPIHEYPEGAEAVLTEPGGRIMAVHPDAEPLDMRSHEEWQQFTDAHPEIADWN